MLTTSSRSRSQSRTQSRFNAVSEREALSLLLFGYYLFIGSIHTMLSRINGPNQLILASVRRLFHNLQHTWIFAMLYLVETKKRTHASKVRTVECLGPWRMIMSPTYTLLLKTETNNASFSLECLKQAIPPLARFQFLIFQLLSKAGTYTLFKTFIQIANQKR